MLNVIYLFYFFKFSQAPYLFQCLIGQFYYCSKALHQSLKTNTVRKYERFLHPIPIKRVQKESLQCYVSWDVPLDLFPRSFIALYFCVVVCQHPSADTSYLGGESTDVSDMERNTVNRITTGTFEDKVPWMTGMLIPFFLSKTQDWSRQTRHLPQAEPCRAQCLQCAEAHIK